MPRKSAAAKEKEARKERQRQEALAASRETETRAEDVIHPSALEKNTPHSIDFTEAFPMTQDNEPAADEHADIEEQTEALNRAAGGKTPEDIESERDAELEAREKYERERAEALGEASPEEAEADASKVTRAQDVTSESKSENKS
jgi:hypothetical protein